jgi:hypothetical protein
MPSLREIFFSDPANINLKWGKDKEHPRYRESIFVPVAPEWATGEVLVGAAYRKLLLNVSEAIVDREHVKSLSRELDPSDAWDELFKLPTGLASPPSPRDTLKLPQLMPLVPSIARYACVLGTPRGRWDPGNLLLSTIGSGCPPPANRERISRFRDALRVDDRDDLFARFLEFSLQSLPNRKDDTPKGDSLIDLKAPAWRYNLPRDEQQLTPAERFSKDLDSLIVLKSRLTRRQWTVLVEALLRIGLTCHELWLCQLAFQAWHLALAALETQSVSLPEEIEATCWTIHLRASPSLELGKNALPLMKMRVRENAEARIGLTLLLHAFDDLNLPGGRSLGVPGQVDTPPAEELAGFLRQIADHASDLTILFQNVCKSSLRDFVARVVDTNPDLLGTSSGYTRNLFEFLRYNQLQLQTQQEEQGAYDQAYLLLKKNKATNAPWIVQPGPAMLIMMVHACCQSQGGIPTSMDDFRSYLGTYGIYAPAGELQSGHTGRNLEQLGLVVDSPDAGGGRLLVDPF